MENIKPITIEKITVISTCVFKPGMVCEYYVAGRGCYGLVVVSSGELLYEFANGARKALKEGEVALFPKNTAYRVVNVSHKDALHYSINFNCEDENAFERECYFDDVDLFCVVKQCERITHFWRMGDTISKMRAIAALYEVLGDLFEGKLIGRMNSKSNSEVRDLAKYVEENLDKNLTIENLAAHCMMSKTNFRRVFTKLYAVSPVEYIIRVRLSKAAELIAMTPREIFAIASICGFDNPSYFCKLFKKRTGYSPSAFRKNKIAIEDVVERINRSVAPSCETCQE